MNSIFTAKWWTCAGVRALKTMAQSMVGMLAGDMVGVMDVNWVAVLSVACVAGITSMLTSIAGLPEVE